MTSELILRSLSQPAIPDDADGKVQLGRACLRGGKILNLTFALCCQGLMDGPGSWTQQRVAEAMDCSQQTVSNALLKITNYQAIVNSDHEPSREEQEAAFDSVPPTKPKPAGPPVTEDQDALFGGDVIDGDVIEDDDHDDAAEMPAWSDEELALFERLKAGETVVINMRDTAHPWLYRWADDAGLFVRIDRRSDWGNPFEMPADGDRARVIANYAHHYLPFKPSLLSRLSELRGKALGCWCAPEPCHGDVLKARAEP